MTQEKDFDDGIINPAMDAQEWANVMGQEIKEEQTKLELLIKNADGKPYTVDPVIYMPQSIASSLDYDDGTPMTPPGSRQARKPKFDFHKWAKERLPKLNDLALRNIRIINDLDGERITNSGDIPLSKISSGEFFKLEGLCFPGASEDAPDSEQQNPVSRGKGRKGIRGRQPDPAGE